MIKCPKPTPMIVALVMAGALTLAACSGSDETPVPTIEATPNITGTDTGIGVVPTPAPLSTQLVAPSEVPEELEAVWEVWALLAREFVDKEELDPAVFAEAAIRGMLQALEDPYTSYVDPHLFRLENQDVRGTFEGIGAEVTMTRDGRLMIISPIAGTPAEQAGVRPGDVIMEVDGENISGLSLLEAVLKIRGPRGSKVRLLIQHLGATEPVLVEVIRDVISVSSVRLTTVTDEGFAHIRVRGFLENTAADLRKVLEQVQEDGATGIVLDLRDNPGGLLTSTVDVASQFLKDGLVLYEIDGYGRRADWRVRRGGVAIDIPLVVLVNGFSASGSEVLVGALQDSQRATIVGTRTFGKGSVNILRPLSNGGGLYVTFARWYTPSGRLIEGEGIEPDIVVEATDPREEDILQFNKAIEVLESQVSVASS